MSCNLQQKIVPQIDLDIKYTNELNFKAYDTKFLGI
jgi:hypothetical protein